MNTPTLELRTATVTDTALLRNLVNLYLYDFSELVEIHLNEDGVFAYGYADDYWFESGRFPFIILLADRVIGFALVTRDTSTAKGEQVLAELFILKNYRQRGIGREVADELFSRFSGWWEVGEAAEAKAAQKFWRRIIAAYTNDNYEDYPQGAGKWQGPLQMFVSKKLSKPVAVGHLDHD